MPVGSAVHAAREGVVINVAHRFFRGGTTQEVRDEANFVQILHDDGTTAVYAHLQPNGLRVRSGQRVQAGQPIGLSGNTGYSTAPHLHFVVQLNRGMGLRSQRYSMLVVDGVVKDGRDQLVEELEGFFLVSNKRVDLCVATEADTFAEVVHVTQVLNPFTVDHLAHQISPCTWAAGAGLACGTLTVPAISARLNAAISTCRWRNRASDATSARMSEIRSSA